jgi:hypothetical protein
VLSLIRKLAASPRVFSFFTQAALFFFLLCCTTVPVCCKFSAMPYFGKSKGRHDSEIVIEREKRERAWQDDVGRPSGEKAKKNERYQPT